jgi:Flp pilus assembly pilin Flp
MSIEPKCHRKQLPAPAVGSDTGQTLVEYSLVLLVVSTAVILALSGLGAEILAKLETVISGF